MDPGGARIMRVGVDLLRFGRFSALRPVLGGFLIS